MRCEHCHENEASITYTTVEGNETKELHVCPSCFQELLRQQFPSAHIPPVDIQPLVQELLSMFVPGAGEEADSRRCPHCGTGLEDFRKTGMFGCDACYETFSEEVDQLLPRIQGAKVHTGERPAGVAKEEAESEREFELQNKLDLAVADERYEDAALLRDAINELKEARHEG